MYMVNVTSRTRSAADMHIAFMARRRFKVHPPPPPTENG